MRSRPPFHSYREWWSCSTKLEQKLELGSRSVPSRPGPSRSPHLTRQHTILPVLRGNRPSPCDWHFFDNFCDLQSGVGAQLQDAGTTTRLIENQGDGGLCALALGARGGCAPAQPSRYIRRHFPGAWVSQLFSFPATFLQSFALDIVPRSQPGISSLA